MKKITKKHLQKSCLSQCILTLVLLSFLGLAGCASNKIIVPDISDNAAGIHLPGKFVWFDLFTMDMTAASNFYDALLGWDFQRTNEINPAVKTIYQNGKPIGNMIGRNGKPGQSKWLAYMSVENVDAGIKIAQNNGGSEYKPAKDLPDRGRVAVIEDPQGATVALLTSPTGDPLDKPFVSNRWLGCELWTTNVDAAVSFYQKLAGYDVRLVDVNTKVQYKMLLKNGKRRGGVVSIPWKNVKPEWIPYIVVDNALQTTIKAQELGGKVLIPPDMSVKEGHIAIISDPTGAVFGIQQLR
jgi:predicted enzyme related to lactoylglutathione lyase